MFLPKWNVAGVRVTGAAEVKRVTEALLEKSQLYIVEPLPDDEYEIFVKAENERLLRSLADPAAIVLENHTLQFVDLSTRHIRAEDDAILHDPPPGLWLPFNHMPYLLTTGQESEQVGWFISLPEDDEEYETYDPAVWGGLSRDFFDLFCMLHNQGVAYLRLDRDAQEHPALPTFNWESLPTGRILESKPNLQPFPIPGHPGRSIVRRVLGLDPDRHIEESED